MITKIAVVTKITETKYFSNKNDLINYLITESEVVTENLKLRPCRIDRAIARSIREAKV